VIGQLVDQVQAARVELAEARAEYAAKVEAARDHFLREAKALREVLARAKAESDRLRAIIELGSVERTFERLN
jgi:hypothetical protein